ncbi:hypothetical protein Tco_1124598 [Tanacetum coccineum]|uniref:Uncharacterized protein n=1 Tax=Tanacetum coccineum TaxID=301880 RepID=A0ABQ5J6P3_9ASTR
MDYRSDMRRGINNMTVAAEEIEDGIRRLMNDHEMRNKVKQMKEKSRLAGYWYVVLALNRCCENVVANGFLCFVLDLIPCKTLDLRIVSGRDENHICYDGR